MVVLVNNDYTLRALLQQDRRGDKSADSRPKTMTAKVSAPLLSSAIVAIMHIIFSQKTGCWENDQKGPAFMPGCAVMISQVSQSIAASSTQSSRLSRYGAASEAAPPSRAEGTTLCFDGP